MSRTKCEYSQFSIFVLGEKIKKARKERGLTLVELGNLVNLTHSALSKIENNKNEVSRKTLIALAQELNNNFGEEWLDEYIIRAAPSAPTKKEIVDSMSVEEFISLKFDNQQPRRSRERIKMLSQMLEEELNK